MLYVKNIYIHIIKIIYVKNHRCVKIASSNFIFSIRGLLKWHSYFGDIVFEDRNTPDISRNFCYVGNHGKH